MSLSDSPSSASVDASSEEEPAWFRMEMNKGITKIQETLSEHLWKMYVLVDKLHEDQKVTKGWVTKLEEEKFDYYEHFRRRSNLRFQGFLEAGEGRDAISILQEWIPKILDLN